ncbi:MAG: esterase/lipase family protein [Thermodesulfobacteriota bacterium]
MPESPRNLPTDLRGIGNLTVDAIAGITEIVESLHQTITGFAGMLSGGNCQRRKGISGLVYRNVRTVSQGVGNGFNAALGRLSTRIGQHPSPPAREAMLAALNGVIGDHLAERRNPLAIAMQFRQDGQPLTRQALSEIIRQSGAKLAIMVHGSCMNDLQWRRNGHDHGAALAKDLGLTPLYVHYNTGRHISQNGRALSDLFEELIELSPQPPELFIVAHSMGGLVCRSACHCAKTAGRKWLLHLRKIVFLGTPHHGAMLEKGGNIATRLMEISPYSAPFARIGKIRSAGITDMRYGNVSDADWQGTDRFEGSGDPRTFLPLPESTDCYTIAATTAKTPSKLCDGLIGDGLVTVGSALGRHRNPEFTLLFPKSHQWIARGMGHMALLDNPAVYATIRNWLQS